MTAYLTNWLRRYLVGHLDDDAPLDFVPLPGSDPRPATREEAKALVGPTYLLDRPVARKTQPSPVLREIERRAKVIQLFPRKETQ